MRIIFFGTTDFSANMLRALFKSRHDIRLVVTLPDRPSERGHKPEPTPVKIFAQSAGIPIISAENMEDQALLSSLGNAAADLGVVVAFKILPKQIFDLPRFGTINVHPSILPDLRGPAPLRWAIIKGYKRTGITVFRLNEKIDAGEILGVEHVDISEDETYGELFGKIQPIAARLLLRIIDEIGRGIIEPKTQIGETSKAPKITKETSKIDWKKTNSELHNLVRAMNPQPGAWTISNDSIIRIFRTGLCEYKGEPGRILICDRKTGEMVVACGTGSVRILEIQVPGKKVLDCRSYLCGSKITEGEFFS